MVGAIAALMSSTVVNVAIPALSQAFALGQDQAQWVSSGFMAASVVGMLTTPWMLTRFGFRRTYELCLLALMVGGLLGGLADRYALVLTARLAEGWAAGVVQPIPAIVILRAFQPDEQGRASGLFGMGVVLAPALGPSLGGVLVEALGWRSIFFMVLPFGVLSLWLARRYVPVTAPGGVAPQRGLALDRVGLVLATVATLALLTGLVAVHAAPPAQAALHLVGAAVALAAFVAWQRRGRRRGAPAPLLQLAVFRHRAFAAGSWVALIYGAVLFGSTYLIPVHLQMGLGLPAAYVGALLLPAGLVLAATIAIVGRLADRQPAHRLVAIGLAVLTLSFVGFALVQPATPLAALVALAIVGRVGLGFVLPSLNLGAMRALPASEIPQGSSAIGVLRMLGGAVGVSLCGMVVEWRWAALALPAVGAPPAARLAAFAWAFWLLAALCALALLSARALRPVPPARH
ncbi:Riboflavin transporter RibZ [Tepidimonas thermarum]|uniref:Riboflavin transporter RibZ n=1 Tax=Tepidimonas thermarum TaxID=335431 RepID=A0A554WVQ3_9BURK|nr:MFS transporter [Tepidimonas thermarum]TSE27658.1 Riboflavin transporter RibZ [Tepidimonas thermarum]